MLGWSSATQTSYHRQEGGAEPAGLDQNRHGFSAGGIFGDRQVTSQGRKKPMRDMAPFRLTFRDQLKYI
jgi:hypothetical protein